jgi:hypothetical protein
LLTFLFVRMASLLFLLYVFWNLKERTKEMQLFSFKFSENTCVYTDCFFTSTCFLSVDKERTNLMRPFRVLIHKETSSDVLKLFIPCILI